LIEETDPRYVNFELDSYWMADAGVDVPALKEKPGGQRSYKESAKKCRFHEDGINTIRKVRKK